MKTCLRCKTEQPFENFAKSKGTKDGYYGWCRACASAYNKTRPRQVRSPEKIREYHLRHKYGITPEQFDALLESQGGTCATCFRVPSEGTKRFSVDHDHSCCPGEFTCGKCIRGLLCGNCNTALGLVNDEVAILDKMRAYLLAVQG